MACQRLEPAFHAKVRIFQPANCYLRCDMVKSMASANLIQTGDDEDEIGS